MEMEKIVKAVWGRMSRKKTNISDPVSCSTQWGPQPARVSRGDLTRPDVNADHLTARIL